MLWTYPNLYFLGKLDKGPVLKALCAGFRETTEPAVCLSEGQCIDFPMFPMFTTIVTYTCCLSGVCIETGK